MIILICLIFLSLNVTGTLSANETAKFIFNGDKVNISKECPFLVAIYDSNSALCTGFLVSENRVITAKHCCQSEVRYILHSINSTSDAKSNDTRAVKVETCYSDLELDVAVLVLAKPVKNIPLLTIDTNWKCSKGQNLTMYGFGIDENKEAGALRRLQTKIVNCDHKSGDVTTQMSSNTGCYGDSGAPLIAESGKVVAVHYAGYVTNNVCQSGEQNLNTMLSNVTGLLKIHCAHCKGIKVGIWEKIKNIFV